MDKFISIKKACTLLECNEEQLYQVLNDQPRMFRNKGTGMQRKLCEYDVLEWRKRRSTIDHELARAVPHPKKEIKYKIVQLYPAPNLRKKRGKELIYPEPRKQKILAQTAVKPTEKRKEPAMTSAQKTKKTGYKIAPATIQQGAHIFHNLARVSENLGRAQASVMVWLDKSSFKIIELSDPNEKGSPKRKYIREEAVRYVTKLASERKTLKTQKAIAREAGQDSMELITIPEAAEIMKVKDAKVRYLVEKGKLKGYGPRKLLVKIYEVRKAILKSKGKPNAKSAPRPPSGPLSAPAGDKTSTPINVVDRASTRAPLTGENAFTPIDLASGASISELDKEILNKSLDMSLLMGDLSIIKRVLQLLGA